MRPLIIRLIWPLLDYFTRRHIATIEIELANCKKLLDESTSREVRSNKLAMYYMALAEGDK